MSALGSLVVSLTAQTAKFEAAMNRAQYVANQNMGRISRDVSGMKASFDAIPGAIGKVVTAAAALTGIAYVFKQGIKAVDDYQTSIIGIAATLTDLSKPGQGSMEQMFARNKVYAEDMYRAISMEAAKHFSTAGEMMTVYNRLVQGGYAARLDEVAAIGMLSDKIKQTTKGQGVERQLNTELMALMEGQVRQGSLLAMELKSRLGPSWADIVEKHKQAGDLLKWMTSIWPGLVVANKEIENTLEAQWATTKSLLELLAIGGLGGAYQDIVGFVKEINTYLKDHGKELAGAISTGWAAVKDIAGGVVMVVSEIVGWLKTGWGYLEGWRSSLSAIAKQRTDMGVAMGLDVMPGLGTLGVGMGDPDYQGAIANQDAMIKAQMRQNEQLAKQAAAYKKESYGLFLKDMGPTKTQLPAKDDKGKGAKAIEAAQNRLENFIQQMKQLSAKAAGESFTALEEWYRKETTTIQRLEDKLGTSYEARSALDAAYQYKRKALVDKFAESEMKAFQENAEKQEKIWLDSLDIQKNIYTSLADLMPNQIGMKQKVLDLDIQINQAAFEKKLLELEKAHIIEKAQGDELRGLQGLINATKKYNLEMENNKSLAGWAWSRNKELGQKSSVKDLMGSAENFLSQAFSSGLQGVLSKDKNSLKDIGKTMFQGFLGGIHKGGITRTFDALAKVISPAKKDMAGNELAGAGQVLNSAGLQLATSAGGLLLSGIGIMTNSQALVYAGTILQLAGFAIQLYQTLTATTQMTAAVALTGSAAALSAAASMLMVAAAVDSIPFFHRGGMVTAHLGWPPPRPGEVDIRARVGERVLTEDQNREWEAGRRGEGGGRILKIEKGAIVIDARGGNRPSTTNDLRRAARKMVKEISKLS